MSNDPSLRSFDSWSTHAVDRWSGVSALVKDRDAHAPFTALKAEAWFRSKYPDGPPARLRPEKSWDEDYWNLVNWEGLAVRWNDALDAKRFPPTPGLAKSLKILERGL